MHNKKIVLAFLIGTFFTAAQAMSENEMAISIKKEAQALRALLVAKPENERAHIAQELLFEKARGKIYPSIIRLLLQHGAKVDAVDEYGNTPLHLTAERGSVGVVRSLLDAGANMEAVNRDGETALLAATHRHNIRIVEFLLAAGANLKAVDKWGDTALDIAQEYRASDCFRLLKQAGCPRGNPTECNSY